MSPLFLPYPLLLSNLFGSNISVLPFVSLLLFLQTLHYTIVPYVCAAHKEVSLESADANYKFNLHFNQNGSKLKAWQLENFERFAEIWCQYLPASDFALFSFFPSLSFIHTNILAIFLLSCFFFFCLFFISPFSPQGSSYKLFLFCTDKQYTLVLCQYTVYCSDSAAFK